MAIYIYWIKSYHSAGRVVVTNTNAWQDRIGFGPFKRLQKSDIDDFSDDIDMLTIDDDDFSDTVVDHLEWSSA